MPEDVSLPVTVIAPGRGSGDYLISGSYDALKPCAEILNAQGIIAVTENENGAYRLRVAGVKNPAQLAGLLGKDNVTVQYAEATAIQKAAPRRAGSLAKWFSENKIKVVGIANTLGDLSMFSSGIASKRTKEASTGLIYISGGIIGAYYGDPSVNRQIKNVGRELGKFMQGIGAVPGKNTALYRLLPKEGKNPLSYVDNFLYQHPSEALNGILAVGGTQLLQSGLRKRSSSDPAARAGWMGDAAAGALVTTAGATGALIPEDHRDSNEKPRNIKEWIASKPLRLAGALYLMNNVLLLGSAWQERKKNPEQKSYIFKFMAGTFFLIANTAMAMSSRHNPSSKEHMETKNHMIGGMAAEVIATQPDEMARKEMIGHVAQFLSQKHETRQDMAVWEKILQDKVDALVKANKNTTGESIKETQQSPKVASWQEKVAAAPEASITQQSL